MSKKNKVISDYKKIIQIQERIIKAKEKEFKLVEKLFFEYMDREELYAHWYTRYRFIAELLIEKLKKEKPKQLEFDFEKGGTDE